MQIELDRVDLEIKVIVLPSETLTFKIEAFNLKATPLSDFQLIQEKAGDCQAKRFQNHFTRSSFTKQLTTCESLVAQTALSRIHSTVHEFDYQTFRKEPKSNFVKLCNREKLFFSLST